MRLGDASMADLERAGQRFYELKGLRNGEDDDTPSFWPECCEDCPCAEPDDTLQPWEIDDPDDEIIADPPERLDD